MCEQIAGVPLWPSTAQQLHQIYLAKGVRATTAIEGNTLSEEEVAQRLAGELRLAPSKEYLGTEIDNVIAACNEIDRGMADGTVRPISPDRIRWMNRQVLQGLELEEGVVPGDFREHPVGVERYRAAPPQDCAYLVARLCEWLSGPDFAVREPLGPIGWALLKPASGTFRTGWQARGRTRLTRRRRQDRRQDGGKRLLDPADLPQFVATLTGWFFFVILDTLDQSLTIINDRFASIPFYYHLFPVGQFYGAITYTHAWDRVHRRADFRTLEEAFYEFIHFQRLLGDKTYDTRTRFLWAGSALTISQSSGDLSLSHHWLPISGPTPGRVSTTSHTNSRVRLSARPPRREPRRGPEMSV